MRSTIWRYGCALRVRVIAVTAAVAWSVLVGVIPAQANNFWEPLNGPTGGNIYAIARDPNTNTLYAATGYQFGYNNNAGSVFKSADNGDHWTYCSSDLFALTNPIKTRIRGLSVNTAGHLFVALDGIGVWRSFNGGANWSPLNNGLGDLKMRVVEIAPTGETYAVTDTAGVYQLNGSVWSATNTGLTNLNTRCMTFGTGYALVGTNAGGVFKRTTGGNWSAANNGLTATAINALCASAGGARLLACTNTGLFESLDHAASWQEVVGPFSGTLCWSVTESTNGLLLGTAAGIYQSNAAGTSWTQSTNGYTGAVGRVVFNDGSGRLFTGSSDAGLFRSEDNAQSWSPVNTGLYGRTVTRLLITGSGTILAGTNAQGIFRSNVLGATWSQPALPQRSIFALAESPWGDLFAGNYTIAPDLSPDGHAWRSSDDGITWSPLDNGLSASMVSGFVFPGPTHQVTCSTAWGMNSIRTSQTNGDTWQPLTPAPGFESYCLARNVQGDLFTGSEGHGVKRFSAASQTWTSLGLNSSQQFAIAFSSQGHVFVGNDGNIKGVYKSVANGDALSPLNSFPSNYGYAIACLPNDDLYVGTRDAGIQYSNDGGNSWTTVNSGIPVSSCQALALGCDGHLYAGVAGFGVYRSALPVVSRLPGDIDGDNDVDAVDQTLFVNVLLGNDTTPIRAWRSDLNSDGAADGDDAPAMVTLLLE